MQKCCFNERMEVEKVSLWITLGFFSGKAEYRCLQAQIQLNIATVTELTGKAYRSHCSKERFDWDEGIILRKRQISPVTVHQKETDNFAFCEAPHLWGKGRSSFFCSFVDSRNYHTCFVVLLVSKRLSNVLLNVTNISTRINQRTNSAWTYSFMINGSTIHWAYIPQYCHYITLLHIIYVQRLRQDQIQLLNL